ncbi:periplasmic heavy metal sensor [Desulfohalobium retbaense]|uniref:Zinc resistance-associated protein n=1 Tax=Desulfohalobium retbaense (strain ATCC 49708 / DSM 5692 / JCM 16813 / HR100) TaxID=485915 RepID=C8X3U2_DESRD|nr:periplasmic heavy metal sensor [Desulfohalobium retbaense]ACV69089.1 hypothetical protein Dret_1805 [Desulfohalobium retbaense DSM 5692]
MNKRTFFTGCVVLLVALLATSAGWAQGHGEQGMMRGQGGYAAGPNQGPMYGPYGMDQEQYQALQEIGEKYQQEYLQLRTTLVNKRAALQALLAGPQVEPEKARAAYEEVQDVQADLFELRLKQRNELQAQGVDQGYGMGPGMMRGYGMGPGMMHGPGMGRGMMGGYGMGPGMMQGYGMGPGMMHGPAMGPGMMHGPAMGPGMMRGYGMGPGWMHNNW